MTSPMFQKARQSPSPLGGRGPWPPRKRPSLLLYLFLFQRYVSRRSHRKIIASLVAAVVLVLLAGLFSQSRRHHLPLADVQADKAEFEKSMQQALGIGAQGKEAAEGMKLDVVPSLVSYVEPLGFGEDCVKAVVDGLVKQKAAGGESWSSSTGRSSSDPSLPRKPSDGGGLGAGNAGDAGNDAASVLDLPKNFVYVYELDPTYHEEMTAGSRIRWWSTQYEVENEVFDLLAKQNLSRTFDPDKAALFYVPFFSARYTLWKHVSEDSPDFLTEAVRRTSEAWSEVLRGIRSRFPYFDRSNGQDHFSVLSMDHGRCTALLFCDPSLYGEMFFFQLNGDKMVRSSHISTVRQIQALTYNYNMKVSSLFPDIPCYMSDRDIVVPPLYPVANVTPPAGSQRPITALFRFSAAHHHGVPIPHWNHLVRKELLETYANSKRPGWDFGVKSERESANEWKMAKFCICPPGHSQWTSRPAKSIVSGCIPVTFYRDHDNPWQDDIVFSHFSVNIDVDRLDQLPARIEANLNPPTRLAKLQDELERVQELFAWGRAHPNGARRMVMLALKRRAIKLLKEKSWW